MLIRRETEGDLADVREVVTAAFTRADSTADPVEAALLDALRADPDWCPTLSLVAEWNGEVVGHAACSHGRIGRTRALALGPLSVRPDRQRAGVGSALVHSVLGGADALGEPVLVLLGSPAYYGRFGFVAATGLGIEPPVAAWGRHFQVRTLAAYTPALRGRFAYSRPFDDV